MKERLQRFMMGRNGFDEFASFSIIIAFALCILDLFIDSALLHTCFLIIMFYTYFRILSRNYTKRYQENQKFLQIKNQIVSRFQSEKSLMKQRKTHHIYKCPTCGQKIRIPRGKGRICITCPKCKTEFTKTS